MQRFLAVLVIASITSISSSDEPKEPMKVGTLLIKTNAVDLAKEFKSDPVAAAKKYNPDAPKGVRAGAIVELSGEVSGSGNGIILLKNDSGIIIVVTVPEMPKDKDGRWVVTATGKFAKFNNGTLQINADSVKYNRIIGEEKGKKT